MEIEGFTKNERKYIQTVNKPHSKIGIVCIIFLTIFLVYSIIDLLLPFLTLSKYDPNFNDIAAGFFLLGTCLMIVAMSIRERFFRRIIIKLLKHNK